MKEWQSLENHRCMGRQCATKGANAIEQHGSQYQTTGALAEQAACQQRASMPFEQQMKCGNKTIAREGNQPMSSM